MEGKRVSEKNYHSRLLDVSKKFDHVIEKLKSSYVDQKYRMHWAAWLLLSPVRDIAKVKDLQNGLLKFFNSSVGLSIIPFLSLGIGPMLFPGFEAPLYIKSLLAGATGYLFSIIFYFPMLINFNSDHFHIGAYRVFRNQEYNLFTSAFLDSENDFYFKGLYDYVTSSGEVYHLIDKRLGDFLQNERTEYKSEIKSLQDQLEKVNENTELITEKYDQFTGELIEERDELLRELEYLIQLLKDINMLLFRKFNGQFSTRDLNILTGFTLYEMRGDTLVRIEDVQTSAASPEKISLKDKKYANYGAVKVALDKEGKPYYNTPYPGRIIVSFRINMDNKVVWIYNFHGETSDDKIMKLLVDNGKIDSREIYRLVHALCLLSIDKDYLTKKEAVNK